jgi:hypothetical protein
MKKHYLSNFLSNSVLPTNTVGEFLHSSRGRRCRTALGDKPAWLLLVMVYAKCTGNIRLLSEDRNYLARELCGADNWADLPKGMRTYAGICLAYLATSQTLPLRMHTTKSGKGSKKYWIQPVLHVPTVPPTALPKLVVLSGKDIVVNRR